MPDTDPDAAKRDAVTNARIAFGAVGATEHRAMAAETAARAGGATDTDLEICIAETLGEAGCGEYLDALRLLAWRARGLSQSLELIDLGGPRGSEDPMMLAVVVTASALADIATALYIIRDPNSENSARDEAAESWRGAMRELSRLTGNEPVELASAPSHAHHQTGAG